MENKYILSKAFPTEVCSRSLSKNESSFVVRARTCATLREFESVMIADESSGSTTGQIWLIDRVSDLDSTSQIIGVKYMSNVLFYELEPRENKASTITIMQRLRAFCLDVVYFPIHFWCFIQSGH